MSTQGSPGTFFYQENKPRRMLLDHLNVCMQPKSLSVQNGRFILKAMVNTLRIQQGCSQTPSNRVHKQTFSTKFTVQWSSETGLPLEFQLLLASKSILYTHLFLCQLLLFFSLRSVFTHTNGNPPHYRISSMTT